MTYWEENFHHDSGYINRNKATLSDIDPDSALNMANLSSTCVAVLLVGLWATLCTSAPASVLPVVGKCWTNGTHYGDSTGVHTSLPDCWVALCDEVPGKVIVATPCTAGPDIEYNMAEMVNLVKRYCYPSIRGELPGDQCCGGYPICKKEGANKKHFNRDYYLNFLTATFKD